VAGTNDGIMAHQGFDAGWGAESFSKSLAALHALMYVGHAPLKSHHQANFVGGTCHWRHMPKWG
jgi:hypothetical protein